MPSWLGRRLRKELDDGRQQRIELTNRLSAVEKLLDSHTHLPEANGSRRITSPAALFREGLRRPGDALSALTLLGLAVYAIVWVCYSSFYGQLGVRPEDVGLTYAAVLVRAGVGVAALVLAVLVPIIPLRILFSPDSPDYPKQAWAFYIIWWALMIWLAIYWFLPDDISRPTSIIFLAGALFLVSLLVILGVFSGSLGWLERRLIVRDRRSRLAATRVVGTLVALLLVFTLLYLPYIAGWRMAKSVKSGRADTGGLDTHVVEVRVTWVGADALIDPPDDARYMYLGQADQTVILYEATGDKTYRVPSQSIHMTQAG